MVAIRASMLNGLVIVHHRLPAKNTIKFPKSIGCIGNNDIELQCCASFHYVAGPSKRIVGGWRKDEGAQNGEENAKR